MSERNLSEYWENIQNNLQLAVAFYVRTRPPHTHISVPSQPGTKKPGAAGGGGPAEIQPCPAAPLVPGGPGQDRRVRESSSCCGTPQRDSAEGDGAVLRHVRRAEQRGQEDRMDCQELLSKVLMTQYFHSGIQPNNYRRRTQIIDVPFISWVTFFFVNVAITQDISEKNEEPTKQQDEVNSVNKQPFCFVINPEDVLSAAGLILLFGDSGVKCPLLWSFKAWLKK